MEIKNIIVQHSLLTVDKTSLSCENPCRRGSCSSSWKIKNNKIIIEFKLDNLCNDKRSLLDKEIDNYSTRSLWCNSKLEDLC